jgi:hypothetical protein
MLLLIGRSSVRESNYKSETTTLTDKSTEQLVTFQLLEIRIEIRVELKTESPIVTPISGSNLLSYKCLMPFSVALTEKPLNRGMNSPPYQSHLINHPRHHVRFLSKQSSPTFLTPPETTKHAEESGQSFYAECLQRRPFE